MRERLRSRGRVEDVIDYIVSETSRNDARRPSLVTGLPILEGYAADGFDEAVFPDGHPRPSHAAVLEILNALGSELVERRQVRLQEEKETDGVVFRHAGQNEPTSFPVDLVPRVLLGEQWSRLQGGTAQRARALDAFLRDVYGEAAIVRDGVVPDWVLAQAPGHRPAGTAPPSNARRAHVCGFDIVRDGDGRWLVLEDNLRIPSGAAYALENRRLLRRVLPELFDETDLLDPEETPFLLRRALTQCAPPRCTASDPSLVLLTDGPGDSAFFEHRMLAREMGIPLVLPADLLVDGGDVWRVEGSQRHRVDVIYMRIEDALAHRAGASKARLGPQLVEAVRAGGVTLANALGNGVADDKAVYAYVPRMIEYYLGEKPLLEQVPTYHCADPDQQAKVLARIEQFVVKPVDGYGGLGVVIGPHATDEELQRARSLIARQPSRWIAQDPVALSTHPTYEHGVLRPRHVDLRVFVYHGAETVVAPAVLTRVAPPGSLVVNSSRGGGAKDTWLSK